MKPDCIFHYVAYRGPVYMDNGVLYRSRRVQEMTARRKAVTGPRGVHAGMTQRQVRSAMGPRMRTHYTTEGGTVYLLVGPRGVTEWASFYGSRVYNIGLSPRYNLAKRNADIQGC